MALAISIGTLLMLGLFVGMLNVGAPLVLNRLLKGTPRAAALKHLTDANADAGQGQHLQEERLAQQALHEEAELSERDRRDEEAEAARRRDIEEQDGLALQLTREHLDA